MSSMANATVLPPIPDNIAQLTAPQLIGTLFNWALYGVLSVQTYVYYLNFPEDKIWNKILVYGSYIFEVVQTAMTAADLYFWFASGFGNLTHLGNVNISPADTPVLCGIIAAIVQCFFAYRIYTLRRSFWFICILIILTSIVQTAGAFGTAIRAFKLQEYSRFHENVMFPQSFDVWLMGDTVCDVLISGTMLWLYHKSRQEGSKQANQILGKLVRLIIETNTLTAGMALLSFICYVGLPNSNLFICTTLIMGKLYSNTLLVTFNNRIALRKTTISESGGSSGKPNGRPYDLRKEVTTFHVASDRFGGDSSGLDSYEIRTLTESKQHELTSVASAV